MGPPPTNWTLPTSVAAGERLVVGLLRSNPYSFPSVAMRCSSYSVSMRFARWCAGRAGVCRLSILFASPARSRRTNDCRTLPERRTGFRRMRTHACFFLRALKVGWDRSVETCVVALRGNLGPGCATCSPPQIDVVLYPGSHRVGACLYYTGVAIVEACGHSSSHPISSYCTGVIPVEERGHSTSPTHFCRGSGLRLGLCTFSARGRSSRGIYHSSTFDGGGVV